MSVLQANFCWLGDLKKKGPWKENRQFTVSEGIYSNV